MLPDFTNWGRVKYPPFNRVLTIITGYDSIKYTYDSFGRLTGEKNYTDRYIYTYDAYGNMTAKYHYDARTDENGDEIFYSSMDLVEFNQALRK